MEQQQFLLKRSPEPSDDTAWVMLTGELYDDHVIAVTMPNGAIRDMSKASLECVHYFYRTLAEWHDSDVTLEVVAGKDGIWDGRWRIDAITERHTPDSDVVSIYLVKAESAHPTVLSTELFKLRPAVPLRNESPEVSFYGTLRYDSKKLCSIFEVRTPPADLVRREIRAATMSECWSTLQRWYLGGLPIRVQGRDGEWRISGLRESSTADEIKWDICIKSTLESAMPSDLIELVTDDGTSIQLRELTSSLDADEYPVGTHVRPVIKAKLVDVGQVGVLKDMRGRPCRIRGRDEFWCVTMVKFGGDGPHATTEVELTQVRVANTACSDLEVRDAIAALPAHERSYREMRQRRGDLLHDRCEYCSTLIVNRDSVGWTCEVEPGRMRTFATCLADVCRTLAQETCDETNARTKAWRKLHELRSKRPVVTFKGQPIVGSMEGEFTTGANDVLSRGGGGTLSGIKAAVRSLNGVTQAEVYDLKTMPWMDAGTVAIVVAGGRSCDISDAIYKSCCAGTITLGSEYDSDRPDVRWYTPETWAGAAKGATEVRCYTIQAEVERDFGKTYHATRDIDTHGQHIPAGTAVLLEKCARCSAQLTVTDVTRDLETESHKARCFAPGDYVRWTSPVDAAVWSEGAIVGALTTSELGSAGRSPAVKLYIERVCSGRVPGDAGVGTTVAVNCLALRHASKYDSTQPKLRTVSVAIVPAGTALPEHGLVINKEDVQRQVDIVMDTVRIGGPRRTSADPLDVTYDGVRLRTLLDGDEFNRRESSSHWRAKPMTPTQRAAVSAYHSAQLRERIAKAEAERKARETSVVIGIDPEDL